jgi:hypothetical protein
MWESCSSYLLACLDPAEAEWHLTGACHPYVVLPTVAMRLQPPPSMSI